MGLYLHLTDGKHEHLSTNHVIDDIRFQSNEDILKYLLSTIKTSQIYKISKPMGTKDTYVLSSHICKITIE